MIRSRFRFPRCSLLLTLLVLAGASAIPFLLATEAPASGGQQPIDKKIRACQAELKDLRAAIPDVDVLLKKARSGDILFRRNGNGILSVVDVNLAFLAARLSFALPSDNKKFIQRLNRELPGLNADVNDDLAEFSQELADYYARQSREAVKALTSVRNELLQDIGKTAARCAALIKQKNPSKPPPPAGVAFVLISPVKVSLHPEFTINAGPDGKARWHHGGQWDVEYTFKVPEALSPGHSYPIRLSINVTSISSENPVSFSIAVRSEGIVDSDPNLAVLVKAATGGPISKTLTLHVPESLKDAPASFNPSILVGIQDGPSFTYVYHRAGA